jgi:hypothetical protein
VIEEECTTCPYWEPRVPAGAGAAAIPLFMGLEEVPAAEAHVRTSAEKIENIGTRAVLVLIAVGMFAVGLTQLTSLLAVPFVIALWLGAAALLGIAAFASLDGNPPPYADSCEHAHGPRPHAAK